MLDARLRHLVEPVLNWAARLIDRPWINPNRLTALGAILGITGAVAAGFQLWRLALALWLLSRLAERSGRRMHDGRALSFLPGVAGATETIVVHSLWLLVPELAWPIALAWAEIVAVNAARQVWIGYRLLA